MAVQTVVVTPGAQGAGVSAPAAAPSDYQFNGPVTSIVSMSRTGSALQTNGVATLVSAHQGAAATGVSGVARGVWAGAAGVAMVAAGVF